MKEDLLFGRIALLNNLISQKQLSEALAFQKKHPRKNAPTRPLALVLLDKEYINHSQFRAVLEAQKKHLPRPAKSEEERREDMVFAYLATKYELLEIKNIVKCLKIQSTAKKKGLLFRLYEVMMSHELLDPETYLKIINLQEERILKCNGCDNRFNVVGLPANHKFDCKKCGCEFVVPKHLSAENEAEKLLEFKQGIDEAMQQLESAGLVIVEAEEVDDEELEEDGEAATAEDEEAYESEAPSQTEDYEEFEEENIDEPFKFVEEEETETEEFPKFEDTSEEKVDKKELPQLFEEDEEEELPQLLEEDEELPQLEEVEETEDGTEDETEEFPKFEEEEEEEFPKFEDTSEEKVDEAPLPLLQEKREVKKQESYIAPMDTSEFANAFGDSFEFENDFEVPSNAKVSSSVGTLEIENEFIQIVSERFSLTSQALESKNEEEFGQEEKESYIVAGVSRHDEDDLYEDETEIIGIGTNMISEPKDDFLDTEMIAIGQNASNKKPKEDKENFSDEEIISIGPDVIKKKRKK